jgi:hypothetical protein
MKSAHRAPENLPSRLAPLSAPAPAATAMTAPVAAVTAPVTATAGAPAITAASTAAARTPTAAFGLRTRFIYIQCATSQVGSIERGNRPLRFRFIRHFDKSEPTRAAGIAIGLYAHTVHCAIRLEQGTDLIFSCPEVQVPDEYIFHVVSLRDLKAG